MESLEAKFRTGAASSAAIGPHHANIFHAPDDTLLIRRAQAGHWEAFAQLASHYDRSILALTLRITGSEREARDLFQGALLQAYREMHNYRFQCSFYLWIYRIVGSTLLEFLRRRGQVITSGSTNLQRAIDQLAPRERLVLELKQCFGLKLDTIASILGIDESTARNIFIRAMVALRLDFEPQAIH